MTAKRDYYDVLGVGRDADESAVKSAYRKLAMKYHPDKNPGDSTAEDRFKEATEAYEVLRDPQKKQTYDQFGHAGLQGGGGAGGFGGYGGFDMHDALRTFMNAFGGGGSVFDEMFGGGGGRRRGRGGPQAGADLRIPLNLTLEEIADGVSKKIRVRHMKRCDDCSGSGVRPGSSRNVCPECGGHGEVRQTQRTFLGQFVSITACPRCSGRGEVITDPCGECAGQGRREGTSTISVKIPAGVSSGNYISVSGAGHSGANGGPPGDAIVIIEEEQHDVFVRRGDDVICELPVSFSQVALGDKVQVPTLKGQARVTVPSGTQSGTVLRLRNKGVPRLHGIGRGDQLVRIQVWTPTKVSKDERRLFEELNDASGTTPPKPDSSFIDRLRSVFSSIALLFGYWFS